MANWILSLTMTIATQVIHPGGGVSMSSNSQANTREGFPTEAACMTAGRQWREEMLRRQPGATVLFSCREAGPGEDDPDEDD
jgi:hypothetical protein